MDTFFSSDFTLGILGGGQLGKMILTETRKYDIATAVIDPSADAPCKIGSNHFEQGDIKDFDTVYNFGRKVDLLTFEIEHVNIEALKTLEQEGKAVYPSPAVLEIIQNKGRQKIFYQENNIPTAPFQLYSELSQLKADCDGGKIKFPFVWKSTEGGYDGKGVSIIKRREDLDKLPQTECLAEDMVPFKNELAVIVARNVSGALKCYPVVEMEFHPEANQVEYVICPARIPSEIAENAQQVALKTAEKFHTAGLLAVELFLTHDNEILVNEVAPRVHNSGHYSMDASYTSQFEQHLRAILDLPLGSTASKVGAVMVNLVGAEGHDGPVKYKGMEDIMAIDGVTPHLYGKKDTRPFRKMGHVNITDANLLEARKKAEVVKNTIEVISLK